MADCEWWVFAIISEATFALYALLLLALYIMLSRQIAQHSCGMQRSSSPEALPAPTPAPSVGGDGAQQPAPASSVGGGGAQQPAPAYVGSSDTSSDTSEDSADSPSCSQGKGSGENINYSSLVFPGKGHGPGCARDYENMKPGMDYVNVDPKKRKAHPWPCSSSVASKPVEYTEVKL